MDNNFNDKEPLEGNLFYDVNYKDTLYTQGMRPQRSYATLSMVLGIISIFFFCIPYISTMLGVAALMLAFGDKKTQGKLSGTDIAGIVCGIIGILLGAAMIIVANAVYASMPELEAQFSSMLASSQPAE